MEREAERSATAEAEQKVEETPAVEQAEQPVAEVAPEVPTAPEQPVFDAQAAAASVKLAELQAALLRIKLHAHTE